MATFKNKRFTKRDYECTNIVACVAEKAPGPAFGYTDGQWIECGPSELTGLTRLWIQAGVQFYGYL